MLIPFEQLLPKYNLTPTGIFQCGANLGQEISTYMLMGIRDMIMIEAVPEIFKKLTLKASIYPTIICINECIGDVDGNEVVFNITDNEGQSSSMLEFDTHSKEHPEVKVSDLILLKTKRLDTIIKENSIDVSKYDMLVADLQGTEMYALRGLGEKLHKFNSIYMEVNERHLYKGCHLVGEIDAFLADFGFRRVETSMTKFGWGDALYIK